MRKLVLLSIVILTASCISLERPGRDTIVYVKQLAIDSTGHFNLVKAYGETGSKGSVAIIGELSDSYALGKAFASSDLRSNIDGTAKPDRLPDFAGETIDVYMDSYHSPYSQYLPASTEALREVAVKLTIAAMDTVSFVSAHNQVAVRPKGPAKVIVLSTTVFSEYGRFDIDTLFNMAGHVAQVIDPAVSLLSRVREASRIAICTDSLTAASGVFEAVSLRLSKGAAKQPQFTFFPVSAAAETDFSGFDAVIMDTFDAVDAPQGVRVIWKETSLLEDCIALMREKNRFTHNIAYPKLNHFISEDFTGDWAMFALDEDFVDNYVSFKHI